MNQYSIEQVAKAMGMTVEQVREMLKRCGLPADKNILDETEVDALRQHLERQVDYVHREEAELERMAETCAIVIDTCSLLHEQFPALMSRLVRLLQQSGKALIVPAAVKAELLKLRESKPALRERIDTLLVHLAGLAKAGLVTVYGDEKASFADKELLSVAGHFITDTRLLFITQDYALASDLLQLNHRQSVYGKRLQVRRINQFGGVSRFGKPGQRYSESSAADSASSSWPGVTQQPVLAEENRTLLPVEKIPGEGGCVWNGYRVIRLYKKLSAGGEGTIYDLGDGTVAKIYHKDKLTQGRRDKLEKMVQASFRCEGVCWPQEMLYDERGCFVGFRMKKARGLELGSCLSSPQSLKLRFPDWKKVDTVRLCVTILEKICALHENGILLGDINLKNILVESPTEVWFVDCDSYQIGGYPCPVGNVRFTAPEIQKKDFSTFLRTPGNEAFAVASLLFLIMMPGKSPYAQQDGDDPGAVIREMKFPYPCGENHGQNVPGGSWEFVWSHLPRYIKNDFYHTFQKGGRFSEELTRLSAQHWLLDFRKYQKLLEENKLPDPKSAEIFPNRWKIPDYDEKSVWGKRICVECGEEFDITAAQRVEYLKKGWAMPSRCSCCLRLRQKLRNSEEYGA